MNGKKTSKPQKETTIKTTVPDVKYREVVYLGTAQEAERIGAVTGSKYLFYKDTYGMPKPTPVDEKDYLGLIAEKGKGCARRDASVLFMSKLEWDLELEIHGEISLDTKKLGLINYASSLENIYQTKSRNKT